jgi:hypothetical protein
MTKKCAICGRSDSQVIADAKTLGLLQEFECGIYSCCQISEWADEQWLAWSKAAHEDANYADEADSPLPSDEAEPILVPVRFRRAQVPWYRNPDELM